MKRVVLFDADGVLTLPEELFSQFYARSRGLDPEPFKEFFKNDWAPIVTGKKDLKESIEDNPDLWQWPHSTDKLLELWFTSEDVRNEDLIKVIAALREGGTKCYLATEQERYRAEYMQDVMFKGLFDGHFVTAELGVKKSDPAFFEKVVEGLQRDMPDVRPDQVVFFDDSQSKVDSALSVGIDARLYTSVDQVRELLGTTVATPATNSVDLLVELGNAGKWDEVDSILNEQKGDPDLLRFAREQLKSFDMENEQAVSDLAASIFEKADAPSITNADAEALAALLVGADVISPENYALFRVACALANNGLKHIDQVRTARVTAVLQVFSCDEDSDVRSVAHEYLKEISNTADKQTAIDYYESLGLEIEYVDDPAGKIYKEHRHNRTHLFTLGGGVMLRTDGSKEHHLVPGQEFIVDTEQLHYAVVGDSGWQYIAAFDPGEEKKYEHVIHE